MNAAVTSAREGDKTNGHSKKPKKRYGNLLRFKICCFQDPAKQLLENLIRKASLSELGKHFAPLCQSHSLLLPKYEAHVI